MSIPQWFAGQVLMADAMNARHPRLIVQQNDQTVNNSTTLVNSEITFTPEPNAVFAYELFISYSAVDTADFKWAWNAPGALLASFTAGYAASAATTSADTVHAAPEFVLVSGVRSSSYTETITAGA